MKAFNWLQRLYRQDNEEFQPAKLTTEQDNGVFYLMLNDLKIGQLSTEDGHWRFSYTDEFRQQDRYRRIVGFSDLTKTYTNDHLWPFFRMRIPGLKQPQIREILTREQIDSNDEITLLRRFGRQSISNPYTLEPA